MKKDTLKINIIKNIKDVVNYFYECHNWVKFDKQANEICLCNEGEVISCYNAKEYDYILSKYSVCGLKDSVSFEEYFIYMTYLNII